MSVKNFAPELLNIFQLASQKPFEFDCESEKKALALRARLYYLRLEMRKEKHWLLPIAEAVVISIKGSWIIAHPPDSDITEKLKLALKQQGLVEGKLK